MAIQYAFRIAGRARRITQRARGVFVELRPFIIRGRGAQQFLITEHVRDIGGRHSGALAQSDPSTHERQLRRELLYERREDGIEEDVGVLRVMHDVLNLFREQPRIDGVEHTAGVRDAVVELKVPITVPCQRSDALAVTYAKRFEGIGHAFGAGRNLPVVRAMNRPLRIARDDLPIAMIGRGVFGQTRQEQRTLLHEPKHCAPPHGRGVDTIRDRSPTFAIYCAGLTVRTSSLAD